MNSFKRALINNLTFKLKGNKMVIGSKISYSDIIEMSPKRRYTVRGRIKSRKRRKPTVIDEGMS